ncbi:MAG TPA: SemiSWEET family transporter [Candidatus Paceibacterota bacterium]|nr:SemiSWEET family transporter [Candidatus Paceibacterota bacterium]
MWNIDWSLIGIVGLAVATMSIAIKIIGVPDQIKRNYRRKSTEGVSLLFYVMSFATYFLWALYGFLKDDWVVFLAQGSLGCVTSGIILWQFFVYRKNKKI